MIRDWGPRVSFDKSQPELRVRASILVDDDRTENALRQQGMGRVNWLFVGSHRGGDRAAVLYTLVASCKPMRIDPAA